MILQGFRSRPLTTMAMNQQGKNQSLLLNNSFKYCLSSVCLFITTRAIIPSNSGDGYDVSFYSLATREDDTFLSSFINMVVLATIHAQENRIDKYESEEMPLVSIFGSEFAWAIRDAIIYSGNYD